LSAGVLAKIPTYLKQRITLDDVTWTPIRAAMACSSIIIRNTSLGIDMKLRTDNNDADTEDLLRADVTETITGNFTLPWPRFSKGQIVAYLQAVSGTPVAVITYQA